MLSRFLLRAYLLVPLFLLKPTVSFCSSTIVSLEPAQQNNYTLAINSSYIVQLAREGFRFWNLQTGKKEKTISFGYDKSIVTQPDGSFVITAETLEKRDSSVVYLDQNAKVQTALSIKNEPQPFENRFVWSSLLGENKKGFVIASLLVDQESLACLQNQKWIQNKIDKRFPHVIFPDCKPQFQECVQGYWKTFTTTLDRSVIASDGFEFFKFLANTLVLTSVSYPTGIRDIPQFSPGPKPNQIWVLHRYHGDGWWVISLVELQEKTSKILKTIWNVKQVPYRIHSAGDWVAVLVAKQTDSPGPRLFTEVRVFTQDGQYGTEVFRQSLESFQQDSSFYKDAAIQISKEGVLAVQIEDQILAWDVPTKKRILLQDE